jgi:hypothetical protein
MNCVTKTSKNQKKIIYLFHRYIAYMFGWVIKKNEREGKKNSNKLNQILWRKPFFIFQTNSNNFSFLFAPKDVKQSCSFLRNTLYGQFWPSIIHSFNSFFWQFVLHLILVRVRIMSPNFQKEWSMKYWFRFPNTCYFESYSKFQSFKQGQFFISHSNIIILFPKHSAWSPPQLHQVKFSKI